jgi:hypothetical protein
VGLGGTWWDLVGLAEDGRIWWDLVGPVHFDQTQWDLVGPVHFDQTQWDLVGLESEPELRATQEVESAALGRTSREERRRAHVKCEEGRILPEALPCLLARPFLCDSRGTGGKQKFAVLHSPGVATFPPIPSDIFF